MSVKYCRECGNQESLISKFCSSCGYKFVNLNKTTASSSPKIVVEAQEEENIGRSWNLDRSAVSIEVYNQKITAGQVCSTPPTNEPPRVDKKSLKGFKTPSKDEFLTQSMAECASSRNSPKEIISAED